MAVETTIKITCDYHDCKNNASQNAPAVVSYVKENVENGSAPLPEEAKYVVVLQHLGQVKTFCGQLHAAMYFLPVGYEVLRKKVVEFPKKVLFEGCPEEPRGEEPKDDVS